MDISYKRNHEESFMVVEGQPEKNKFEEKMLRNNQIESLLTFYTMQVNDKTQYWYRITGKESLKDYLEQQTITLEVLEKILLYLSTACEEISRFAISQEHVMISPESIYMEKKDSSLKMYLCYSPFPLGSFKEQFRSITEYLLTVADPDIKPVSEICYEIYEESMKEDFSLKCLIKMIQEKRTAETDITVERHEIMKCSRTSNYGDEIHDGQNDYDEYFTNNRSGQLDYRDCQIENKEEFSYDLFDEENGKRVVDNKDGIAGFFSRLFHRNESQSGLKTEKKNRRERRKRKNESEEELSVCDFEISPEEEIYTPTVLLRDLTSFCAGKLMYDGSGEEDDYMINLDVFRIGTLGGRNEAVLHSKAVSHHHARITRRGEDYYLEDLNSTNGTFLNGEIIPYSKSIKLSAMDRITFADVAYVFM